MPMSRYEIRNEYSLADPELYRAADKDDPEALLEGVAMAGLVGVLRQLGDLAEFAAEIFHDLHEEVMATAARGHGLMVRVQQLESEVPFIEKAFLSQTDQSPFFYNAGVDWHPNVRMDQNLVTQGDLPRFIMDSYEECRGPPRLFLLDKFDVAGAGACLKRYTDPSFFKVETSEMTSTDIQREKKIRKAKKKGPRLRNGETPEVLPTSNAKLHQLFLEERVENGVSNPARRVKLKRRLNGFPFDLKAGKSYMEKFLRTPSPEQNVLQEVSVSSSLSMLPIDDHNESGLEVIEVRPVSPDRESVRRKRNPQSVRRKRSPPPDSEEILLKPSMCEPNEVPRDDKIFEVPNSYPTMVTDEISSTIDNVTGEKDIAVDGESKRESSITGYQSDDIASEIDNYVDAPSTMESEVDTDSEMRVKRDFTSSLIKTKPLVSDSNDVDLHTRSSYSQSSGEPTMSEDGNNSSKKESSSFSSSGSQSSSAENPHLGNNLSERFQSADAHETNIDNASSCHKTADEDFLLDQHPEPVISDYTSTSSVAIANHMSDFEQLTSSLCSIDSIPTLAHSDSEGFVRKNTIRGPEDDVASALDNEERKKNLVIHTPSSPSVSVFASQSGDDSPRSLAEEHAVDRLDGENITSLHSESDNLCQRDSSIAISADLLNEDDSNREDLNQVGGMPSSSNMCNVLSQKGNDTPEIFPTENPIPGKWDHEVPKLPGNFSSDCPDIDHNGDNTASLVSKGQDKSDELDKEDSNVFTDSSKHFSYIMETSHGEELDETSLVNAHNVDAEEQCSNSSIDNQISLENLVSPHVENSPDCPGAVLDAHEKDVISEEETTLKETLLKTPKFCEVEGLQGLEVTGEPFPKDSAALGSSCGTPENLEGSAGPLDTVENDGITSVTRLTGAEVAEHLGSADMKFMNEVHVLLDESESETDQLEIASTEPVVSDNANRNNVSLPAGPLDTVENDGSTSVTRSTGAEVTEHLGSADMKLMNEVHVLLDESESETDQLEIASTEPVVSDNANRNNVSLPVDLDKLVDESDSETDQLENGDMVPPEHAVFDNSNRNNISLPVDFKRSVEEHTPCSEDLHLDEVKDYKKCPSGSHEESGLVEEVVEIETTRSDLEKVFCNPNDNDHLKPEVPDNTLNMCLDLDVEHSLDLVDASSIQSQLETSCLDVEQESIQQNSLRIYVSDVPSLPINSNTEETIFQEKFELPPNQLKLLDSSETGSGLSPLMPINPQQMLDQYDDKGENNSASMLSIVNSPSPRSFPELPGLSSNVNDVSGYPNDPLDSIFPPSNHFSETNQINLDELPPLPPLPPVQWRMGKLQQALFNTEGDIMKHELFPQVISPPTASTDAVSSSFEEMNHSLVQFTPGTASKEEKLEHSLSSLEANAMYETIQHQPTIENEPPQPTASTKDVKSLLEEGISSLIQIDLETISEIEKVEHSSSSLESCGMNETVDLAPNIENELQKPTSSNSDVSSSLEETNHSLIHINPETASKEEKVQLNSSSLEANAMHEPIDNPPKREDEQQKFVMPFSVSELKPPAEEDGVANGSRTVKLPWPRNPLIESVAALDKSKLRKVTERVIPEIQKVDERDSILEQIRAKSFNLKPAMASRPSIRGPRTNLKVAAILEKANAIRQAFAGSDEDDEDNWSDS
ncbi:hypothetical protein RD792_011030 [Penstemon davidsonii]|uniref:Protein SCAR n=1 Tax=Penstemon davidsonii TaxID=160366 RepID=A0ABR0D4V1_9LAMI|nr:hypothetical protein RD792_011030 [Penstemon davidsonii]